MALKTEVIVSGINNLSDARYCAGMGVKYLGFNIDEENDKYVNPETLNELKGWVSGVEIVTESATKTNNSGYDADSHLITEIALLENCNNAVFLSTSFESAKANIELLSSYSNKLKGIILTNPDLNLSEPFLSELSEKTQVYIGSDIDVNNINQLIENTMVSGIALQGGDEIRPGFKDYDELADILEAIEID